MEIQRHLPERQRQFFIFFFSSSAALSGNSSQPDRHDVRHQSKYPCLAIQGRFKIVLRIKFDLMMQRRRAAAHRRRELYKPATVCLDRLSAIIDPRGEKKERPSGAGVEVPSGPSVCSTYLHPVLEPSGLSSFFFARAPGDL